MTEINTRKFVFLVIGAVLAAGFVVGGAYAAQKLSVEKKGTYIYWLSYKDAKGVEQVSTPARFKGKETEIDLASLGARVSGVKLYVLDKRTSNTSILDIEPLSDLNDIKSFKLVQDGFVYVPSVKLKVVSTDGAPLESAVVRLIDGEGTKLQKVLTPADGGVAVFTNVGMGDVEVKIEAEGAKKTLDGEFEIPEKRDAPGFEKTVKVSGDVATLKIEKAETAKSAVPEAESASGSGIVLSSIVGIVLLVIVGAIIFVVIKSRGFTAEDTLKKLGVQIPEDQPNGAGAPVATGPAVDPNQCAFCGQIKDASGKCACSLAPGASPFGASPAAFGPSGPRLIGSQGTYSGSIFPINGSATIGRDPGCEVPLPNDTTASRRHATISAMNGSYSIRDEGSSNGTFVNGARITDQKLTPGDEVQVGGTRFRFEV